MAWCLLSQNRRPTLGVCTRLISVLTLAVGAGDLGPQLVRPRAMRASPQRTRPPTARDHSVAVDRRLLRLSGFSCWVQTGFGSPGRGGLTNAYGWPLGCLGVDLSAVRPGAAFSIVTRASLRLNRETHRSCGCSRSDRTCARQAQVARHPENSRIGCPSSLQACAGRPMPGRAR